MKGGGEVLRRTRHYSFDAFNNYERETRISDPIDRPPTPSSAPSTSFSDTPPTHRKSHCSSSSRHNRDSSESLSLCTEGLGFESFDDVEDVLRNDAFDGDEANAEEEEDDDDDDEYHHHHHHHHDGHLWGESRRAARRSFGSSDLGFPPPISSICGRSVAFRSFKKDGRFILDEVRRIPTRKVLVACRENGRLVMKFNDSSDEEDKNPYEP
ncbi:hypothetical protein M569_09520 [Genlisea aurea]|uniref:FAF domain-containing protein n=1 Tax=Genlisea aurea TaxID=192259 RepID=S8CKN8_9LAMI|nr:hypothetical protein M569_09520 [Genlisea aurea]